MIMMVLGIIIIIIVARPGAYTNESNDDAGIQDTARVAHITRACSGKERPS